MDKKELTVSDFPLDPPQSIKAAFRNNRKTRASARILIEALFDLVVEIDDADPFIKVRKLLPELDDFMFKNPDLNLRFNHLREQFTIAPRNTE